MSIAVRCWLFAAVPQLCGAQKAHTRITALVAPLLRDGLFERSDREGACRLILTACRNQAEVWEGDGRGCGRNCLSVPFAHGRPAGPWRLFTTVVGLTAAKHLAPVQGLPLSHLTARRPWLCGLSRVLLAGTGH